MLWTAPAAAPPQVQQDQAQVLLKQKVRLALIFDSIFTSPSSSSYIIPSYYQVQITFLLLNYYCRCNQKGKSI